MDLILGSGPGWGDDFGPQARRRSIKERLARGAKVSEGDHLDELYDMAEELRGITLTVSNSRLQLARKTLSDGAAYVNYKEARESVHLIRRRAQELLRIPCHEDVLYRLENATSKLKGVLVEFDEECNHLLRLLKATNVQIQPEVEDVPRVKARPMVKKNDATAAAAAAGKKSMASSSDRHTLASTASIIESEMGHEGEEGDAGPAEQVNKEETLQGYLLKRKDKGKKVSGTKKRWIVCSFEHLIYYDKRDGTELGRIGLAGCKATAKRDDDGNHMMLQSPDASYVFSFIPSTEEQPTIDMWCEFITKRAGNPVVNVNANNPAAILQMVGGGAAAASIQAESPSSDSSQPPSDANAFQGFLLKRKEKNGKFSAPKKRYCVCDGSTFKYMEKKGAAELGTVMLKGLQVTIVNTEDGDCMILKNSEASYSFSSDQTPISEWVEYLVKNGVVQKAIGGNDDSSEGVLSAYLMKKKDKGNGKFTSAKKRWCVCDGESLRYYEKKGMPELGSLPLNTCRASIMNDDDGSWVMMLKSSDASHIFANPDGSTMQSWVDFIERKKGGGGGGEKTVPPLPTRSRSAVSGLNADGSTSSSQVSPRRTIVGRDRSAPSLRTSEDGSPSAGTRSPESDAAGGPSPRRGDPTDGTATVRRRRAEPPPSDPTPSPPSSTPQERSPRVRSTISRAPSAASTSSSSLSSSADAPSDPSPRPIPRPPARASPPPIRSSGGGGDATPPPQTAPSPRSRPTSLAPSPRTTTTSGRGRGSGITMTRRTGEAASKATQSSSQPSGDDDEFGI